MKILIADDDAVSRLYLKDALEDWGYSVAEAADGAEACRLLHLPDPPGIALIDWMMPGMDGVDVCRAIRESDRDNYTYMIMLTSHNATEFIVKAMNAGADDFVSKPFNVEELEVRVRAGRRIAELESKLRRKANHDALTGLYNRGAIVELLQRELGRQQRDGLPVSVIFADVDHFKTINDTQGHLAGDDVLREFAVRMPRTLRPYDMVGRYGGEEILMVLPSCGAAGAMEVAERARKTISAQPFQTCAGPVSITVSMGIATSSSDTPRDFSQILHQADAALYRAKASGRNRVEAE